MATDCPSHADLVLAAVEGEGAAAATRLEGHVSTCADCRDDLADLRRVVDALRVGDREASTPGACLDDLAIARAVDGLDPDVDRLVVAHLAACARCRGELAAAIRVVHDPLVAEEIRRAATGVPRLRRRGSRFVLAGGLAAAALAGLMLGPHALQRLGPDRDGAPEVLRERTITTTAAPRILGPTGNATSADSLTWTSVPRADLYRVTIWRADGTVAWEGESRDTVLALPVELAHGGDGSLYWEVRARTGWDRWVVSELAELTLSPSGGTRE